MNKKRRRSYVVLLMVIITLMSMITGCAVAEDIPIQKIGESLFYIRDSDTIVDYNSLMEEIEKETKFSEIEASIEEKTGKKFDIVLIENGIQTFEGYTIHETIPTWIQIVTFIFMFIGFISVIAFIFKWGES